MKKEKIPKCLRSALNRKAFQLAQNSYLQYRLELERKAVSLLELPSATVEQVAAALDLQIYPVQTPAQPD